MGCVGSTLRANPAVTQAKPDAEPEADTAPQSVPPYVYSELPGGCEDAVCHHVYDGDTLTLQDRRRVRLLGIDTPELKERQPFAEEAAEFTRALCHGRPLFLQFGQEREDHYGRLLAVVWVERGEGGYACVNEGLVHSGLASFYQAGSAPLPNAEPLMARQRAAREAGRGVWGAFVDDDVVATRHGKCFHAPGCEHVARSRVRTLKRSEALDGGLSGCRSCQS